MSNFTKKEIDSLKGKAGGGNAACQKSWLGRLPLDSPARPKPGDKLEVFKEFVQRAYIDQVGRRRAGGRSGGWVCGAV